MTEPFLTVGHSDRGAGAFLDLLQDNTVKLVVDVRKLPGSARYPQFDQDRLTAALATAGIGYRWSSGLTGRRPVSRDVPFAVNAWWRNRSFHNYADHTLGTEFRTALTELRRWGADDRIAVLCSEAVWWRCHRRIIADLLLAAGEDVRHILTAGRVDPHRLSAGAVRAADGRVTYPAD